MDILLRTVLGGVFIIAGCLLSQHLSINNEKLNFSRLKVNICYKLLLFFIIGILSIVILSIVKEINYGVFIISILSLLLLYLISQLDKKFLIIPNILCLVLLLNSCVNLIYIEPIFNIISLIFIVVLVLVLFLLSLKNLVDVGFGDLKLLLSIGLMFHYWFILLFLFVSFFPIIFTKKNIAVAQYIFIGFVIVKILELIIIM